MKPFHQFRLWLHRAPTTERMLALTSGAVVLALLIWVSYPTGQAANTSTASITPSGSQSVGGGATSPLMRSSTPGPTVTAGPNGTNGGIQGGGSTVPGSPTSVAGGTSNIPPLGGGSSSSGTNCSVAAGTNGVTDKEIVVAVILLDLGQVNSFVGIPSISDQKKAYNAIFDSYNRAGGARCRTLVAKFFSDNPLDASSEQATCLSIVQAKPFATLNNIGGSASLTCLPQRKVPGVWYTPPTTKVMHQFAPYIVSHMPDYDRLVADYVVGVQRYGFFTGLKKLGILETSCVDDQNKAIAKNLEAAGYPMSKVQIYNYGCPSAISSPDQDQAAALQFQRAGVTHVMNTAYTYIVNFAAAADRQGYKPHYSLMEDGAMAAIAYVRPGPAASFDGALAITPDQVGFENTPGMRPTPATAKCAAIMKSVGLVAPTTPGAEAGALYGGGCAVTKVLVSAVTNAPLLSQTALPEGLSLAGSLDLSFPPGPMHVTSADVPTGGQFYRGARWNRSCSCWRVIDPTFHPGA